MLIPLVVVIVGAMFWVNSTAPDYPPEAHWKKMLSLIAAGTSNQLPSGFMEREAVAAIGALGKSLETTAEGDRGDGRVRYVVTGAEGHSVMIVMGEDSLEIIEVTREDE